MHKLARPVSLLGKRLLRHASPSRLLLLTAFSCSTAIAGTGYIPSDQDTYPEAITAIPAVLSQCFACHGPNGRSEYDDWPSLAGQKESYLFQQLQDFKSGKRSHPMMQPVVAVLDDEDFRAAAEYLSAQAAPRPAPDAMATISEPPTAAACMACHDNAKLPNEPYIFGQQANYLEAQIHAFKNGERNNAIMQAMVQNLSDEEIADLAKYFSALEPADTAAE